MAARAWSLPGRNQPAQAHDVMRVLLMRFPSHSLGGRRTCIVAMRLALLLDKLHIALAVITEAKIVSQHQYFAPRPAAKTSSTNCCADIALNASLKRIRKTRSTPRSAIAWNFSLKLMILAGASTGEKYSLGNGSNTITTLGKVKLSGLLLQVMNHRLVPQVHAVEGPYGGHATAMSGPQIVQAAYQLHQKWGRSSSQTPDYSQIRESLKRAI